MKNRLSIFCLLFLLLSALLVTCANNEEISKATGKKILLVVATDYSMSGSLSAIDLSANLSNSKAVHDLLTLYKDTVVRQIDNIPYILERDGRDVIKKLDPENNFRIIHEENVGTSSNPKDIAKINDDLGLMSFGDEKKLSVFNLSNVKLTGQNIDLTSYLDANANAIASDCGLLRAGNFIYASISNLIAWQPAMESKLLKIDVTDPMNLTLSSRDTSYKNPSGGLQLFSSGGADRIISAGVSQYGSNDGGVIDYNINSNDFTVSVLTEMTLGQDITQVYYVSNTKAFALLANSNFKNSVIVFDPSDPTNSGKTKELLSEGTYAEMIIHDDRLYVSDRNIMKPGIRIFDVNTLNELNTEPINVGLPPASMVVIER